MEKQHSGRSSFSGKLGFVLSAAGASVGLGNIWRFPYLAAKYGGGIFLLIYILLAVTFGYTMIMAETALGRMTRKSPVGAFAAFGKGRWRAFGGWINAVIPILIVPYYSVIGGWVIKYLVVIMATVIGAMIGTFIVGKLFHFYPVEGMLTAGLCMANGGGAGDVQCLGAAHRMELMSYAQISSRIGGAIMLVIASFVFGKFL